MNLLKKQKQKPHWQSKQEIWEKRTDTVDKKRSVPYEKKQFLIKRETKFGRTPEEALQEWQAFEKTCEDDNLGFKGSKRLWISDKHFKDVDSVVSHGNRVVDEQMKVNNPNAVDMDALRITVTKSQNEGAHHEFFKGKSTLHEQEVKQKYEKQSQLDKEADLAAEESQVGKGETPRKKKIMRD